jgi:FAD/FMN-containing dehydrogenase
MTVIADNRFRTLRRRFRGALIEPGQAGWAAGTQAFNLAFVQEPALVAVPADEQDVIAVVDFAREHGMQVAPQRTGHNAEPLGTMDDVILVRTDALLGVEIDAERRIARVRSGCKWEDVLPRASALGLAGLHGSTPDVSVAGYSLGGGVGWYARKLGLSANSVTAIELVTPDGRLRRVDHDNDPELFWALRGGGGNFGIVTALEIQLYPIAEVYAGALFFGFERASEVLHAWLDWTATVPEDVTSTGRLLQFPPLDELPEAIRGRSFVMVDAVVIGDERYGSELLGPLRDLGPETDTFAMVPPQGIAELHMDPPDPVPYVVDGVMLGDLTGEAIDRFVAVAGPGSDSRLLVAEIRHVGGALRRAEPHHGALASFDASYLTLAVGMAFDEHSQRASSDRLRLIADAFAPYATGREYLNFAATQTDPARFYPPDTYRRLRAVKAAVDPHEVMRANHPIAPAA